MNFADSLGVRNPPIPPLLFGTGEQRFCRRAGQALFPLSAGQGQVPSATLPPYPPWDRCPTQVPPSQRGTENRDRRRIWVPSLRARTVEEQWRPRDRARAARRAKAAGTSGRTATPTFSRALPRGPLSGSAGSETAWGGSGAHWRGVAHPDPWGCAILSVFPPSLLASGTAVRRGGLSSDDSNRCTVALTRLPCLSASVCLLSRRTKSGLDALVTPRIRIPGPRKALWPPVPVWVTQPPPDCDTRRRSPTPIPKQPSSFFY